MDIKAALGNRVRHLREKKGLSQSELAERVDRSVHAISMIERGRNWPNLSTLQALSQALTVSPANLLDDLSTDTEPRHQSELTEVAIKALKKVQGDDLSLVVALLERLGRKAR